MRHDPTRHSLASSPKVLRAALLQRRRLLLLVVVVGKLQPRRLGLLCSTASWQRCAILWYRWRCR